ncbi:hypothetical protein [Leptolinea tardivitalis]|uniref:Uncharacterized protein n=1 Tax=Leptolinea tardivitalis TaxID=229920 RepID=A0A0P6X1Q8_9CHLR|nr:hypothetical protein [Leptolinea tardivitalis]KPL73196.1 hypothetical protein ADM99_02850 [Leptolinea tardivitalis]GAP21298.1 hypothetical protein LTAR_01509 [Leptolinea tardivitalis]
MKLSSARELLEPNQSAIVFFTHGQDFHVDNTGEGETGNWILNPELVRKVDKVIVYYRDETLRINRIYMGNFHSLRKGERSRRWIVRFTGMTDLGTTGVHWLEFGNGSKAPVNYVEKPG